MHCHSCVCSRGPAPRSSGHRPAGCLSGRHDPPRDLPLPHFSRNGMPYFCSKGPETGISPVFQMGTRRSQKQRNLLLVSVARTQVLRLPRPGRPAPTTAPGACRVGSAPRRWGRSSGVPAPSLQCTGKDGASRGGKVPGSLHRRIRGHTADREQRDAVGRCGGARGMALCFAQRHR